MSYIFIEQNYGNYVADRSSDLFFGDNKEIVLINTCFEALCPFCHTRTKKIHQIYERTVIDFYVGRIFNVKFKSRKFYCRKCDKIFTEETPFTIGKCKYSTRFIKLLLDDYHSYKNKYYYDRFTHFQMCTDDKPFSLGTYKTIIHKYYNSPLIYNKKINYYSRLMDFETYGLGQYYTIDLHKYDCDEWSIPELDDKISKMLNDGTALWIDIYFDWSFSVVDWLLDRETFYNKYPERD